MIAEADRYMSYYNLPAWGEQMDLENTVTGYKESKMESSKQVYDFGYGQGSRAIYSSSMQYLLHN